MSRVPPTTRSDTSGEASSSSTTSSSPSVPALVPPTAQAPPAPGSWLFSPQALDDARQGYVSPYPPVPSTLAAGGPAGGPPVATSSRPGALSTIPETVPDSLSKNAEQSVRAQRPQRRPSRTALPRFPSGPQDFPIGLSTDLNAQRAQMLALATALNERRINTIGELRRIERDFPIQITPDFTQSLTFAWRNYVNSNNLLTDLRRLTRNYPFSSECLTEAKKRVGEDPTSTRSWNYCWLVLAKIESDELIPTFAKMLAADPRMWGGRVPEDGVEAVEKLAAAFVEEWTTALEYMLRYWDTDPVRR